MNDNIKLKTQFLELKENDIIIITIPLDENECMSVTMDEAITFFNNIKDCFPNNKVILIPEGINLEFSDWKTGYDYIMSIKPPTEKICDYYDYYKEDFENLKDIITKHPISVRNILEIITTSIPLIDYCGVDCLLTIINNEIKRRDLK